MGKAKSLIEREEEELAIDEGDLKEAEKRIATAFVKVEQAKKQCIGNTSTENPAEAFNTLIAVNGELRIALKKLGAADRINILLKEGLDALKRFYY